LKNLDLSRRQYLETGILLAIVLIIYAWYSKEWLYLIPAVAVLILSLIFPLFFRPLAIIWFGLANILSLITSKILLTILFFLLVTPVGLFRRMLGKDSMKLKRFKKSSESVMQERNHTYNSSDLKNPF